MIRVIPHDQDRKAPVPDYTWTDEAKQQLAALVELWSSRLGLGDYHINLAFSPQPKDAGNRCAADALPNDPYRSGYKVTLYPLVMEADEAEREREIVHELLHFITIRLKELARQMMREQFVTLRELNAADEEVVDQLANAIASLAQRTSS